jgi:hypothetical protein
MSKIKVGDIVRIVRPDFFIKCGYENNHQAAVEKIENTYWEQTFRFIYDWEKSLVKEKGVDFISWERYRSELANPKSLHKIISALAYDLVSKNREDGAKRVIFLERRKEDKGLIATVKAIKTCQTGIYISPKGHCTEEGWEVESGYIKDPKYHRILILDCPEIDEGNLILIEDINVEKIGNCNKMLTLIDTTTE